MIVPATTVPFFSSMVTVSLFSFIRNLRKSLSQRMQAGSGAADSLRPSTPGRRRKGNAGGGAGAAAPTDRTSFMVGSQATTLYAAAANPAERGSLRLCTREKRLSAGVCARPRYFEHTQQGGSSLASARLAALHRSILDPAVRWCSHTYKLKTTAWQNYKVLARYCTVRSCA